MQLWNDDFIALEYNKSLITCHKCLIKFVIHVILLISSLFLVTWPNSHDLFSMVFS